MRLRRRDAAIRWPLELGLLGGATLVWAGGEYVRMRRSPATPIEATAHDVLNAVDAWARRTLRHGRAEHADRISDALAYVAVPLASGLSLWVVERRARSVLRDALKVARAVTFTGALNQVVKLLAPRERPFTLERPAIAGKDWNGSFFSNHTSSMTALAAATTQLLRARGARAWLGAPPLFGLALFVGYLRIAADRHYLTDVLAGAAFGSALGVLFTR